MGVGAAAVLLNQVHLPMHGKPNTETPRFTAEEEFTHKTAKHGKGRTILRSSPAKLRGLGYLWAKQGVVLGFRKDDWRQGRGKVIGVLSRCIWMTCFCVFKMEMLT